MERERLQREIRALNWYHTLELPPGVVTPGHFDTRTVARLIPWPDVRGRRCLDVGTHDGFWAFEMERRGAAEVVAVDLDDPGRRDWPADARAEGPRRVREWGWAPGAAFRVAAEALGSSVKRENLNVYDLSPETVGTFDVVFVGSLLLHLRDPIRALEAARSVTRGYLVLSETIDAVTDVALRWRPVARLEGLGVDHRWWTPNRAGLVRMVCSAGFAPERVTRPYVIPFGASGWVRAGTARHRVRNLAVAGTARPGVPHVALRARPSADLPSSPPG